ncbi:MULTISPECIES: pectate lyase-like adhesive domain-containing protein [unclassified Enterococcus]|uniref:pectate lyase-like adhesive domain-containing protein n=1 Tax=unclassified Enterococcus TaxID=2608891 RepID=UPI00155603D5|nr:MULTISPECIES: pectate lyase-like adhesive domain-containing protein [unclassified Enterococcus]MBS7577965.1 hypothetical protein [Enterococcus sp. MMGLQ5-2]MBS7585174.1 hypothetical protein [Enterococcus sp. MMGLQ5-1]NPD13031.1 hypothetical protein [Enterococcus sp. MMGLQ5-1]NPD37795.1 hypothetical protein [Enterococcus sp. MMGLQ5-2]
MKQSKILLILCSLMLNIFTTSIVNIAIAEELETSAISSENQSGASADNADASPSTSIQKSENESLNEEAVSSSDRDSVSEASTKSSAAEPELQIEQGEEIVTRSLPEKTGNIDVSNAQQFKAAWENNDCHQITLTASIAIALNLAQRTSDINIIGNGFELRLSSTLSWSPERAQLSLFNDTTLGLSNLNITNQGGNFSPGSGLIPILGGNLILDGKVTIRSDVANPAIDLTGTLSVNEGSNITLNSRGVGISNSREVGTLNVERNATFIINSNGNGIEKFNNIDLSSPVTINPASSATGISFSNPDSRLNLNSGANLTISTGDYGIANTSNAANGTLTMADGSNLNVVSNGAGIVGFNQINVGTADGLGATVDVTARARVAFSAPNKASSSLIINKNSVFSAYANGTSGSYSAISSFGLIKMIGAEVKLNSSNYAAIDNITSLDINSATSIDSTSKMGGVTNFNDISLSGSSTAYTMKTSDTGISTGQSLTMTDGASLAISAATSGIKNVAALSLMNTSIASNGTYTPTVIGQSWANLDYGIDGATDVVLAGNVTIGSGTNGGFDRQTSPKRIAISASNSVNLTGNNNHIYGGGLESNSSNVVGGITAENVAIESSDNSVVTYHSTAPAVTNAYTGISNTAAIKATGNVAVSGSANTFIGKGYAFVTSDGNQQQNSVISISGNGNQLLPKVNTDNKANAIDTSALIVSITGNNNNLSAQDNGILNWRSSAPSVIVGGSGNQITATYSSDDDSNRGVAINLTNSVDGVVTTEGGTESANRNEIIGYRVAIKSRAVGSVGGTINLGGNVFISSNSDMTAIGKVINFTAGNIEMKYIGRIKDDGASAEITAKKSVLWSGSNSDTSGSAVNIQAGANVKLNGWGYMDKDNPNKDSNNISSPIHSSFEYINVENDGQLAIESVGNAINWFRDRGSSSTMNRGFAQYIVKRGGLLSLKSNSKNPNVAVVQKLASEPSSGKGNIEIQNGGSFIAEGSGGFVFDLPVGTTFSITNPKVLDLKNTSNRPVFSKQASSTGEHTVFSLNKTNISLWQLQTELSATENTPDYSYSDVNYADITATGSALALTTDHSQFATDFRATDAMSNISRIRAEIKGMTRVYYQFEEDETTKKEFAAIGNLNPAVRYSFGTSLDYIFKTQIKEPGASQIHYRYQGLTEGINALKPLINHYNIAQTLETDGISQYYHDFKGMTWDDSSMQSFENWRASYIESNDSEGNPVYDNPVLKLKKIDFEINIAESGLDDNNQITQQNGKYGDSSTAITIGKPGYSAVVIVNNSDPIILSEGEVVTLPIQYDFESMPIDKNNKFKAVWQWLDSAASDDTISRKGSLNVEIAYTKGADIFTISSAPDIDFGKNKISNGAISAQALNEPLVVIDTADEKQAFWRLQSQITSSNAATEIPGSYLVINDKIINQSNSNFVEKTNDSGPLIVGNEYHLMERSDQEKVKLMIPDKSKILPNKKYEYTITWTLSVAP